MSSISDAATFAPTNDSKSDQDMSSISDVATFAPTNDSKSDQDPSNSALLAIADTTLSDAELTQLVGRGGQGGTPLLPPPPVHGLSTAEEAQKHHDAVNKNARDFESWLQLIKLVEQSAQPDQIKAIYESFLSEFPLCWAFWKRLADIDSALSGVSAAMTTYQKALSVAAPCIDLWVHYCDFMVAHNLRAPVAATEETMEVPDYGKKDAVRAIFERAVANTGYDWKSGPLWLKYLDFEEANRDWTRLGEVFRRALSTPMEGLNSVHARFRALLMGDAPPPLEQLCTQEEVTELASVEVQSPIGTAPAPMLHLEVEDLSGLAVAASGDAVHKERCDSRRDLDMAPGEAAVEAPSSQVVAPGGVTQQKDNLDGNKKLEEDEPEEGEILEDGEILEEPEGKPLEESEEEGEIVEDDKPEKVLSGIVSKKQQEKAHSATNSKAAIAAAADVLAAARAGVLSVGGAVNGEQQADQILDDGLEEDSSFTRAAGRRWLLQRRKALFVKTRAEADRLQELECKLTRGYFHNSPLSQVQLQTWRKYLDIELARTPRTWPRLHAVFQRCLVPANNYLEFWHRYIDVLEQENDVEGARSLLENACASGRLRGRPDALTALAELEEQCGRPMKARALFDAALGTAAAKGSSELAMRRVALELRQGRLDDAEVVLRKLLGEMSDPRGKGLLARRYSRLLEFRMHKPEAAFQILGDAWKDGCRDPSFIADFAAMHVRCSSTNNIVNPVARGAELFEQALHPSSANMHSTLELKGLWVNYLEFLVTHGAPIATLRSAQARAQQHLNPGTNVRAAAVGGNHGTKRPADESGGTPQKVPRFDSCSDGDGAGPASGKAMARATAIAAAAQCMQTHMSHHQAAAQAVQVATMMAGGV